VGVGTLGAAPGFCVGVGVDGSAGAARIEGEFVVVESGLGIPTSADGWASGVGIATFGATVAGEAA